MPKSIPSLNTNVYVLAFSGIRVMMIWLCTLYSTETYVI